ncbi:MAG: NUDIX hydrolase [Planctomycetota bacterium]
MTPSDPRPVGRVLERKVLASSGRFDFVEVTEELPNGVTEPRSWVAHPGAACIVPVLADGRLVLIHQYRSTLGRWILEFPAGTLEAGEDPALTAGRELEEESGYRAGKLDRMFEIHPAPGVTDELIVVYLATELELREQSLDPGECLEVVRYSPDELKELWQRGELIDGKTVAALGYLWAFPTTLPAVSPEPAS